MSPNRADQAPAAAHEAAGKMRNACTGRLGW
jgi:hypothetical protein